MLRMLMKYMHATVASYILSSNIRSATATVAVSLALRSIAFLILLFSSDVVIKYLLDLHV